MASRTHPVSRSLGLWVGLLLLAVLEAAWFAWFLAEPLPNAENVGGRVRHWIFAARALPEVVPGVRFHESYLGLALDELSHVENLPQRVPIVLGFALIGGAAVSLGLLILRAIGLRAAYGGAERLPLAFGLGTTALGILTLLAGRLGALAPRPVRLVLGLIVLAEVVLQLRDRRRMRDDSGPPPRKPRKWNGWAVAGFLATAGPFLLIMALGAMLPTIDFDAIEYHLQGPKEYFQAGRIAFLPHNVYTSMPFSIEMLHLLGMEVLGDWWWGALVGQTLIAAFAPAAAALIALTAWRGASGRAAWFAAVVYLTTPWIYRLGVLPYVEGPLCYFHAALVWAVVRAWAEVDERARLGLWLVIGLLAGGAMACKYPALVSAVVPFGLLAFIETARGGSWRIVANFCLGTAVVMAPWLGKNVIDTGNPVYPLAYKVFDGRHWDRGQEEKWSHAHGPKPPTLGALGESIVDVLGRSDWQSPLFMALAPLAVLRRGSRRLALLLWAYVAYLFLTWWLLTHRLDRFWLPLLPSLAVLAGLGADWIRHWAWSALLTIISALAILTNLAYTSTALTGLNEWTGNLETLRQQVPERLNAPLARLDSELGPRDRVLLIGQAAVFHFRHPIVYNTVFNHETIELLARGRTPAEIRRALADRGVTDLYVDWFEIERYRSPGNYGFTDYVTRALFDRLVTSGVLEPPTSIGPKQERYRVR